MVVRSRVVVEEDVVDVLLGSAPGGGDDEVVLLVVALVVLSERARSALSAPMRRVLPVRAGGQTTHVVVGALVVVLEGALVVVVDAAALDEDAPSPGGAATSDETNEAMGFAGPCRRSRTKRAGCSAWTIPSRWTSTASILASQSKWVNWERDFVRETGEGRSNNRGHRSQKCDK